RRSHQRRRGTLDWSHALLAPAEQALFARLGVFAGGWGVAAAAAAARPAPPPPGGGPGAGLADEAPRRAQAGPTVAGGAGPPPLPRMFALEGAAGAAERLRVHHATSGTIGGRRGRRERTRRRTGTGHMLRETWETLGDFWILVGGALTLNGQVLLLARDH